MALEEVPDRPYATSEKTVGRCLPSVALRASPSFSDWPRWVLSKEFLMRKYEIKQHPLLDALVTFRI